MQARHFFLCLRKLANSPALIKDQVVAVYQLITNENEGKKRKTTIHLKVIATMVGGGWSVELQTLPAVDDASLDICSILEPNVVNWIS